jgi:putative nucleotidyltransferase with HDIG domain
MRSRVLFVDDDPLLREAYRNFAPELREYEVFTAESGESGVKILQEKSFDVVVSDLCLPRMDGMQFLAHVVRSQPDSARIIISGYADRLKVAQCLFVGHRYFNKPCDSHALLKLLERLASFREIISNQKVRRVIGGLGSLPGPPDTYLKLTEILNSAYSSLNDVAAVVEQDASVTAKLLQIVNSAHFGISRKIISPTEAVQMVGVEVVRGLVLGLQAFSVYKSHPSKKAPPANLWDHSLRSALGARRLAQQMQLGHQECEQAFLAGLLHDVGKLVLIANVPEEYDEVMTFAKSYRIPVTESEQRRFGATHAQIGAYLLALWGLQDEVIELVEYHHSLGSHPADSPSTAIALHAAQYLNPADYRPESLDRDFLRKNGCDDKIDEWKEVLK